MGFLFIQDSQGLRLDLLLTDTPFDEQIVKRAKSIEVSSGIFFKICTPEDLILCKMISTRPRDREDLQGIILRQKDRLDHAYVIDWLKQFEQALDDSTLVHAYQTLKILSSGV